MLLKFAGFQFDKIIKLKRLHFHNLGCKMPGKCTILDNYFSTGGMHPSPLRDASR